MLNKYLGIVCVSGAILLTACSAELTDTKEEKPVEEVAGSATEFNLFELSNEEETVYTDFQKDLNLEHLQGLEPMSIAKLYVKTIFDQKYDVEYALYTDREEHVQWSKEDDEKIKHSQVHGKYLFKINGMGKMAQAIQKGNGLISIVLIIIIFIFIKNGKDKKKEKRKKIREKYDSKKKRDEYKKKELQ